MTRDELIEAGARAIMGPAEPAPGEIEGCRSLAGDILDAVAPLIRADERERVVNDAASVEAVAARAVEVLRPRIRGEVLADLRAKVEALVEYGCPEWSVDEGDDLGRHLRRDQVLALIDETTR